MTVYTVVKRERMIPFSGLSRFSGLFDGDRPSPLNRDTTVVGFSRPNIGRELLTPGPLYFVSPLTY